MNFQFHSDEESVSVGAWKSQPESESEWKLEFYGERNVNGVVGVLICMFLKLLLNPQRR